MIVKCSNCVLKWKKTGLRACAVNFLEPILVSRAPFRESLSSAGHVIRGFKDGAYYCYCAYVLRISRYSDFLS